MTNPFASKQSGMASMFESMIPPDVLQAIKVAKEQLPTVIEHVQQAVTRIESKLDMILIRVNSLDPNYVPPNEQLAQPTTEQLMYLNGQQVDNQHPVG